MAEVAPKFGAKYQFAGFGHLVLHHFVHDIEFCRDLQVAIWFAETQVVKVLTHLFWAFACLRVHTHTQSQLNLCKLVLHISYALKL